MALAFIVDATNYLVTYWHGTRGQGQPASDALVSFMDAFCRKHNPDRVHAVFDAGGRSHRHDLFADYKAGRGEKDPALREQCEQAKVKVHAVAAEVHYREGVEADDLIATLTRAEVEAGRRVVIASRDKDLRQLLRKNQVSLLMHVSRLNGKWVFLYLTADKLEVRPEQWADLQALAGESDGWPGADGVGRVTATLLLQHFGTIEGIMAAIKDWPHSLDLSRAGIKLNKRQVAGLRALDVDLAREITRLRDDVDQEITT